MAASSVAPRHRRRLLLLFLSFLEAAIAGASVPALIVFGDSTVDPGNNNYIDTVTKSNFPPYGRDFPGGRPTGRFSNGRLATDFISESLGLTPAVPAYLDPEYGVEDFARAVSFASAGTGLDNLTAVVSNVIPLWRQLELFGEYREKLVGHAGRARAQDIVREAVYVVSIGSNDYVLNYFVGITGRAAEFTVPEFTSFLVGLAGGFIAELYGLGARKVVVFGLGPLGCVPMVRTVGGLLGGRGGGCVEEYNEAVEGFNAELKEMVRRVGEARPGMRLRYAPVYEQSVDVLKNPSAYGIENEEEGCCGTGKVEIAFACNELSPFTCEDAERYMFWDAFHPTQKIYALIAQAALRNVLAEFL